MRKDVARNRQRVLVAAREVIAERGLKARLDEIAHRADVGVGTVYRHFGDRDGLIRALFQDDVDEIVGIGERALEHDDPWLGFEHLMDRMVEVHARSRGVRELLFGSAAPDHGALLAGARERFEPAVRELVRRAQADGSLRDDVLPEDLPIVQLMVGAVADYAGRTDLQIHRRLLQIVLDGLRASRTRPTPLPAPAVSEEQAVSMLLGTTRPST